MTLGLRFSLKDEYRALTISPLNPHKCWEPQFQYPLRELAGDTFPQAEFVLEGRDPHVRFLQINRMGLEILKFSMPFDRRRPSLTEITRVQNEIERLHTLAEDVSIPADRRDFFRNLQLPDPREMPECWRTTGFFKKHLYIVWGIAKKGKHSTFLPASIRAGKWDDKDNRTTLRDALGMPSISVPIHDGTGGRTGIDTNGMTGCKKYGFMPWLLNALTFGWYGHRYGYRNGGCLGSIFSWIIRLLLIMLIASLVRGCLREFLPSMGGGRSGLPVSVPMDGGCDFGGGNGFDATPPPGDAGDETKGGEAPDIPPELNGNGAQSGSDKPSDDGKNDDNPDASQGADKGDDNSPAVTPPPPKPQEKVSNLDVARALAYHFKVNPPKDLPGSDDDVAKVEFSVSPIDDIGEKKYAVSDWRINDDVKKPGMSTLFIPEGGLRYDKTYTISVTVVMDGKLQRVEPFQWNMVDAPTWQILEFGRNNEKNMRQYKLVCCNSSSVKPMVKDWKVEFRTKNKDGENKLDFEVISNRIGDNVFEMSKNIGFFEGAYFMEMTANIDYEVRGKVKSATHVETFPFTHDSSADGLTKAKYEVVIPDVYFCLARLNNGSLINGTAFAISEKLLLSNYHVAVGGIPECYANSGNYKVVGPLTLTNVKGKTFYAKVDQSDRGRDLAVLRLCDKKGEDTDDRLPGYLHLAEDTLVAGISETSARHVFAIGYPKGTVCMGPPAFTDGKAEKVIKRDYICDGNRQEIATIINYTSVKCGYSGGPLVDYQTESVLGVNFGGLIERMEGHKAASLATSAIEVDRAFPNLKKK